MSVPQYVHDAVMKVEGVATNIKQDFLKLMGATHSATVAEGEVAVTGEPGEPAKPVEG